MLESLGYDDDRNKLILIKDGVKLSGFSLFRAILQNSIQGNTKVTVYLYEHGVKSLFSDKRVQIHKNLTICRPSLDWWLNEKGNDVPEDPFEEFKGGSLFLDSLSPLLAMYSASSVYRKLHKLMYSSQVKQLVLLVHGDTQDESCLTPLEHLSTLLIHLSPLDSNTSQAHISGNPTGNKPINRHERFTVDHNSKIVSHELKSHEVSKSTPLQVDLSHLTFNLGIKEDEKVARQNLVLPYTQLSSSNSISTVSGGEIFYQPDAVDDFDEEDPDDDLDI